MGKKPLSATLIGRLKPHGERMARRVPTERQVTGRVATSIALALAYPFASFAADEAATGAATPPAEARSSASAARAPAVTSDDRSANPYAGISNEQLAEVADRWPALNQDERRWFFVEVRKRLMATDGAPALPIGASARFGQVVRNRDGTVTRIETMRATARPAGTTDARNDPRAYGLGFERRFEVQAGSAPSPGGSSGPTPASVRLPASGQQRTVKPDGGT